MQKKAKTIVITVTCVLLNLKKSYMRLLPLALSTKLEVRSLDWFLAATYATLRCWLSSSLTFVLCCFSYFFNASWVFDIRSCL